MKMYDTLKSGVKATLKAGLEAGKVTLAGAALYAMTLLPACTTVKVTSPKDYAKASARQLQKYEQDGKFTANEIRELASTYQRIDDLLEKGVEDEARKKELETRRALLGQIVDYVAENAEAEAVAYVSGINPEGKVKNNPRLETGLSGKTLDEEVTKGKDEKAKTRKRSEYLLRIQDEATDVMNMHGTDVDNDAWHNNYVEENTETAGNLIAKKGKFGAWTERLHKKYTNGKKEDGEVIRYAFGLMLKEAVKVPEAIAATIRALNPKNKKKATSVADLEAQVKKEEAELAALNKRLAEAKKKAAEKAAKKAEEAKKAAEEAKKAAGAAK